MKRRSVAVLLTLTLLFGLALSGCGGGDKAKLEGTWETTLELADQINQELSDAGLGEYVTLSSFPLVIRFVFNADGTYSLSADEASLTTAMENMKGDLKSGLTAYAEGIITDAGMEISVDDLFSMMGTSLDQLMEEAFSDEDLSDLAEDVAAEGNYQVKDGKLFLSDGKDSAVDPEVYEVYEFVSDSELRFTENVGGALDEEFTSLYPLTLKKV